MKFRRLLSIVLLLVACGSLFGCGDSESKGNLNIYLYGMPMDIYSQLSANIRSDISIGVTLHNRENGEITRVELTDKNGYNVWVDLPQDYYDIGSVYMTNTERAMFDVETDIEEIKVTDDDVAHLAIVLKDVDGFQTSIMNNIPTNEILQYDIFSRMVQYNGVVMDLNKLPTTLLFLPSGTGELAPDEQRYIGSSSHPGVSIIVQNNSQDMLSPWDCAFIGVHFSHNNIVLPPGVKIGMDVGEISHSETGLFKTPTYFTGTPLMGSGLDGTNLVYYNSETGDQITCQVLAGENYVSAITYKFSVYS